MPEPSFSDSTHTHYPSQEEITRNRLMDAGIVCIDQYGLKKTNMRVIAEASGLARQTVYKYFKNRDDLLSAAFVREGIAIGEAAARHLEQFDSADKKLVEGFLYIYEEFPKNPILVKVIEIGSDFFNTVGMNDYPYAMFGELVFSQVFKEHPYLQKDADSISELWIRNVMSFLMIPGPTPRGREEIESFVRQHLLPGVGLRI